MKRTRSRTTRRPSANGKAPRPDPAKVAAFVQAWTSAVRNALARIAAAAVDLLVAIHEDPRGELAAVVRNRPLEELREAINQALLNVNDTVIDGRPRGPGIGIPSWSAFEDSAGTGALLKSAAAAGR
jgi:hypothetical protein